MEDMVLKRVSVMTLILVIFFGILQYIPQERTYDSFIPETALKVISISFFSIVLFPFLIYLILIAINLGYGLERSLPERLLGGIYNFTVLITFFIIFMVVGFGLILNLVILSLIPIKIGSLLFLMFFALWIIGFSVLFSKYVISSASKSF